MTKRWNILAVVMLLGAQSTFTNPVKDIVIREANQFVNPLIAQTSKGMGNPGVAGPLRQTGVLLDGKKVDVSKKLDTVSQEVAENSYLQNAEANIERIQAELAKAEKAEQAEPLRKELAEAKEFFEKAKKAKEEATRVSIVNDTPKVSEDASTVTSGYLAKTFKDVQDRFVDVKSALINRVPSVPSSKDVRNLMNSLFKKDPQSIELRSLKKSLNDLRAERTNFKDVSEQAEFLDAKIEETLQGIDRLTQQNKANSFFTAHKNKFAGVGGLGALGGIGAIMHSFFTGNAEEQMHIEAVADTTNNQEIVNGTNFSDMLTKKNAAITAGILVGAAALYQLWSMFTTPSFEQLVIAYLEETEETNPQVIVEQFCTALKAYGYTSDTYQEKAIAVLVEKGLVEA